MDVSQQFSGIRLVSLVGRKTSLSNKARHRELFEHLLNSSDQIREARINTQTLFSAYHFSDFFNHALNHLALTSVEPFDFVATSRIGNEVSCNLQKHLMTFLHHIKTPEELLGFAIPVIASSFLFNSYLPDIHRE